MVWLVLLLALLGGCGSAGEEVSRSTPVPATKELGDPAGQGLKWSTLDGFASGAAPTIPAALDGLQLGATEADARAALARIQDLPDGKPRQRELEGRRMLGVTSREFPEVGVTAIIALDRGVVEAIDLSVPADQALLAFTESWGEPTIVTDPSLGPIATWTNAETGLQVDLLPAAEGRAIAKLHSR